MKGGLEIDTRHLPELSLTTHLEEFQLEKNNKNTEFCEFDQKHSRL